jgi:hypothetical protein
LKIGCGSDVEPIFAVKWMVFEPAESKLRLMRMLLFNYFEACFAFILGKYCKNVYLLSKY